MNVVNDDYMHIVGSEPENAESLNEDKAAPENNKSLGKVLMKLENGSSIVCDVKISWTECIKFWLSSFIAMLLLWFVILFSAGMFASMFRGY